MSLTNTSQTKMSPTSMSPTSTRAVSTSTRTRCGDILGDAGHLRVARATPVAERGRATSAPAARRAASHLTRRGRLTLIAVVVAVVFGAFSLGRSAAEAAPEPVPAQSAPAVQVATVQPGESLWTLARRIAPDNDTREVVAQIRRLNDLKSSQLQAGQQLVLPVAA